MTAYIDLMMRSSAIVVFGLACCAVLRHRSAALRHFVLAVAVFAAAAVVPFTAVVPTWTVDLPASLDESTGAAAAAASVVSVTATARRPAPAGPTPASLIGMVWVAGVCIGAGVLLAGLARLAWISRRATRVEDGGWKRAAEDLSAAYGLRRAVTVLQTDSTDLLATYGLFRPRVLLPAGADGWPSDRVHGVLCHELAHIRRCDWGVQICAEALRTIYWFNPLMWLACARLRIESEQACDDAVLGQGVAPRQYASQLLELARMCRPSGPSWISATPMARPSRLERRITAMLNPAVDRASLSRRAVFVTIAMLASVTLPIAALRAGQGTSAPLGGAVYDPTGAVLPGVSLTLANAQDVKATATTDRAGRFEFAAIPPGEYVLEAALPGFRPLRQQLQLRNSADWDRAITLQVGELTETITVRASRVAAQPPVPGTQLRVGGNIRVPTKLRDVKPVYPESMRAAGREGVVPMEAIIGRDGTVSSVRVLSAEIHPDFAISAADAVRQWKFAPTLLNGETVEVRMQVSVTYTLSQ